jgi:lipoate-protein ligase A
MTPMRAIDTGLRSARWHVAMTAALAELHRAGRIPDTAYFHRYPASLLIGRRQSLGRVVRLDRARRANVEIARRSIGDEAACRGPGQLALHIVAERGRLGSNLGRIVELLCGGVADGLSRLGLPARVRRGAEVEIAGCKVANASCDIAGTTVVYQGAVLIDADDANMPGALLRPKLGDARASVGAGESAGLGKYLGRVPADEEIVDVLVAGLSHRLRRPLVKLPAGEEEIALAQRLFSDPIGSDVFVEDGDLDPVTAPIEPRPAGWAAWP